MAATKNNQWWKLRAKHGRDKIFESPEMLWDACTGYFEETDKRKWNKTEYKSSGKGFRKIQIPTDTPYTINGLCLYLGIDLKTWNNYRNLVEYKDFFPVITQVEQIIYIQKFEGASVGAYNANIISRELGLADKTVLQGDKENPLFDKVQIEVISTGYKIAISEDDDEE